MVVVFFECEMWLTHLSRIIPTWQTKEDGVFVPAGTDLGVKLNHYKGSGWNKKLPPRRLPTVGIVRKVLNTTNTTIHIITTMVVPFAPFTVWDIWIRLIGRR